MKANFTFIVLGLLGISTQLVVAQDAVKRCANDDYALSKMSPKEVKERMIFEEKLNEIKRVKRQSRLAETTIRVPVVVHVIHSNSSGVIGGDKNSNISDEQILSQIKVLNEDYRRKEGTNGFNADPVGADMNIEFYLATRDPSGLPTNGITRTYNAQTTFDIDYDFPKIAGIISWPTDRYLNIWVADLSGQFLGYAQFPSVDGVPPFSLQSNATAFADGVYLDYEAFGTTGAVTTGQYRRSYNLGRTCTHEVGHWLGLIHTWGDNICGDDYCDDTPDAETSNDTGSCNAIFSNCFGGRTKNMIENYMDFSFDKCMNIFTKDQKDRVRAVFELSQRRRALALQSFSTPVENLTVNLIQNPTSSVVSAEILIKGTQDVTVELYDLSGRIIYSVYNQQTTSFPVSISVNSSAAGVYILKATTNDEVVAKRVLVTR